MKRTEIERREREIRRQRKREEALTRSGGGDKSVGDYINELFGLFLFNEERIFNTTEDEDVLELLEEIQEAYPEKAEVIVKKAIRKTKVAAKDQAFAELSTLMG